MFVKNYEKKKGLNTIWITIIKIQREEGTGFAKGSQ